MALLEERLHDYWQGNEADGKMLEERLVNTIAPAILVKKKGVLKDRLKPALVADKMLSKLTADQRKAFVCRISHRRRKI